MAKIVAVHGIGQQFEGEYTLRDVWFPALRSGLQLASVDFPGEDELICAFYGDVFRPPGTQAAGVPPYDAADVTDEMERELLQQWWREAAQVDEGVPGPEVRGQIGRTPVFVQRALDALS